MLLDDDVVTNGKAQPSSFAGRLCRKERIEQLLLHFGRNSSAVVADAYFNAVAKVLGRGRQRGLVAASSSPHVKLTGDFGNAIEVIRIGDCFPLRIFAKNS
jgi:hypothetical protein